MVNIEINIRSLPDQLTKMILLFFVLFLMRCKYRTEIKFYVDEEKKKFFFAPLIPIETIDDNNRCK